MEYVDEMTKQIQTGDTLTIIVPEFVSNSRLTSLLHTNTADLLRKQLRRYPNIVVIDVPYHVN